MKEAQPAVNSNELLDRRTLPEREAETHTWDEVFITTYNDDECANCGEPPWVRDGCFLCIPLKEAV